MTNRGVSVKKIVVTIGVFLAFVFCFFVSVPVYAQVTGATLSGTITDASGGVIAGAQISVRNTATGATKDATADSAGFYAVPNLIPGAYEVKVTAKGFSTTVQSNLTLAVGQQQQLNIPMRVGETAVTVQVTEAAPQIDLTSSTLTGQVESQTVLELPLNGRDWTSLATLHPGVNLIETQMTFDTAARGNRGFGAELTISGGRTTQNNYRIDGISVNDYAISGPGSITGAALGVDAIQEFSVLTGSYSAEYGRASGGVLNAISKSGTNAFHGDVYEFLRNSKLDSRDYFNRAGNRPRPAFRRNQFGGAAGGPIIKNRTFIFGDYEGFRQGKGIPISDVVPTPNARLGILQDPKDATKNQAALVGACPAEPTWTQSAVSGGAVHVNTATNHAPGTAAVCIDDSAFDMLRMFQLPNPGTYNPLVGDKGKFISSALQIVPENFYTGRVDHKIGTNDNLFGTYLFDDTDYTQPDAMLNDLINSHTTRTTFVLEESHTFSPSFVNAVRVGYNRNHAINFFGSKAINPAASDLTLGSTLGRNAPRVDLQQGFDSSFGGVGSQSFYRHNWNSYQYYDDAFVTHGAHSLKFGVGVERMLYNFHTFQGPGGRWKFGGLRAFYSNTPKYFEAGLPNTVSPRELRQTLFGGYFQDDWRFRSNLTLNIGLRYEMVTVIHDGQGKISSLLNISDPAPQCGKQFTAPTAAQAGSTCGSVGPYYSNPTLRNFEPRIGFAWDPFRNGKTSVRGGFGVYDVLPLPGYFLLQQNQSAPFMVFKNILPSQTPQGPSGTPLNVKLNGAFFPQNGQDLLANSTTSKLSVSTIETNPHRNYVMQWNLNVQRQIGSDLTATIGYIGSRGIHMLIRGDDGNMTSPVLKPEGYLFTGPRANPGIGVIRYIYWGTNSAYDALTTNLQKKMGHGFQAQVAYTWSKSLDANSSTIAGDTFGNGLNSLFYAAPGSLRGPSDFNVTHSLVINGLWDVPGPKSGVAKAVLGGWELGSIFKLNSGVPTTPIIDGDPMGLGNGGADTFGIPNRVAGCDPINHNFIGGTSPKYLVPSCFSLPTVSASSPTAALCSPGSFSGAPAAPSGTVYCANLLGNAGRNSLVGPRLVNVDFSVFKNIPVTRISETFKVQFRTEMFNVLNHSNFQPPDPYHGGVMFGEDGSAGASGELKTPLTTDPREIQFALKVVW